MEIRAEIHIPAISEGSGATWGYLSLVFTLFYFFPLIAHWPDATTTLTVIICLFYLAFVALYCYCLRRDSHNAVLPVALLMGVAFIITAFYAGSHALYGYPAFLAAYYFRLKLACIFLAANIVCQLLAAAWFDMWTLYFIGPSLLLTVGLFLFGRLSHQELLHDQITQRQNQKIEQLATIAERERIARDLHDLLGHSLSSLALKSELAEKLLAKREIDAARVEINEVAELSRSTLAEIRVAITGLNLKGFHAELDQLCQQLERGEFLVERNVKLPPLGPKTESALILLCKSWVTNILRHSKGNRVRVTISHESQRLRLEIWDNGQPKEITPGNGIGGMRARVDELGGEMSIGLEQGVLLTVELPVHSTSAGE